MVSRSSDERFTNAAWPSTSRSPAGSEEASPAASLRASGGSDIAANGTRARWTTRPQREDTTTSRNYTLTMREGAQRSPDSSCPTDRTRLQLNRLQV